MTSFSEIFKKLAEQYPAPKEPMERVEIYWCEECREVQVEADGDLCPKCVKEWQQGFKVRSLAGRCANGGELDHGTRFHALRFHEYIAVCGAKPGRRSVGWSTWGHGEEVTCPRCRKKLGLE